MEVALREAVEADVDFVVAAEREPDAARFVGQWSPERHRQSLSLDDEEHLIILGDGEPEGFAMLQGLEGEGCSVEIRRIVVATRGAGRGRKALELIVNRAFERHRAHRVWLDTFVWNTRARRAYAAVGFVEEGILREALLKNGRHESLVVMSILCREWPHTAELRGPSRTGGPR